MKKGGFSANMSTSIAKISNENKMMMENKSVANEEEVSGRSADEIKRLKLLVQQKDNEITLLLSLINKKRSQQAGKG